MDLTHYEVLGVAPDADGETIRAAYRKLARETHPDVGGNNDDFVAVAAAWAVLSDPDARARYDGGLGDADGWGEDVGLTTGAPRKPSPPPTEPARPSRERVDEWTSGRRALPPMTEELGWLPPPVEAPSLVVRVAFVLVYVSVAIVVAMSFAQAQKDDRAPFVFTVVYAFLLAVAALRRRDAAMAPRESRKEAAVILWSLVGAFPLLVVFLMTSALTGERAPAPLFATALGMAGCLVVGLRTERQTRRARRWYPAVAAMHERRALAEAWDAFLAAQELYQDVARVEPGVLGPMRRPIWALVPVTGGELLASAPIKAPEAWAATLRLTGVDADSASGQPASA